MRTQGQWTASHPLSICHVSRVLGLVRLLGDQRGDSPLFAPILFQVVDYFLIRLDEFDEDIPVENNHSVRRSSDSFGSSCASFVRSPKSSPPSSPSESAIASTSFSLRLRRSSRYLKLSSSRLRSRSRSYTSSVTRIVLMCVQCVRSGVLVSAGLQGVVSSIAHRLLSHRSVRLSVQCNTPRW